jgi:diphthamide synthase (EF-2-diphthine--ammonia ligase)
MVTQQLVLPMSDPDKDALVSARVREACKAVATELGYKHIAELWDCDEAQVGHKLNETNRNYIKPREMYALKRADVRGIIVAAEMEELGYEMPERKVSVTAEETVRRLPGVLRELFAPELAELVERKLGLR